jgi:hypothetical protein
LTSNDRAEQWGVQHDRLCGFVAGAFAWLAAGRVIRLIADLDERRPLHVHPADHRVRADPRGDPRHESPRSPGRVTRHPARDIRAGGDARVMLRFEVSERDRPALPAIDIDLRDLRDRDGGSVAIGSAASAQIRLPAGAGAGAVQPEHVRIDRGSWTLIADATVDGVPRAAGDRGPIAGAAVIAIGAYQIRVTAAPAGAAASPPRRTESLARELVRSLLGDGAAPSLEIERGPHAGARRTLPLPGAALVIGRGDEAGWVIATRGLSRAHAEVRRGWDGVTVVDLGSRNGTRIDGAVLGRAPVELRDGAVLALGGVAMRFRDPAERHLRGDPPAGAPLAAVQARARARGGWPVVGYAALAGLAVAALIWILAS